MKRYLYIIILFVSGWALPIQAQVGEQRHNLAMGINAGLCDNSVSFQPTIKQSGFYGTTGGFTARYISEKYFNMICGAQLELNYSQLGWKEKGETGTTGTYTRTMDYIQIPFLAHLALGKETRGIQIFFNAGPQIGFLLHEKEKFSDDFSFDSRTVIEQYGKMVNKKFDYGIVGGMGFELKTGIGNFLIEGRYYYGLGDFYNTTKKDYFSRAANMTVYAKVTYLFDLSK